MRFEVILASLVAFVAAAPVEMASDGSYGKYTLYSSYTPYGNYGTAAEAAAAKMQIGTLHILEQRVHTQPANKPRRSCADETPRSKTRSRKCRRLQVLHALQILRRVPWRHGKRSRKDGHGEAS